MKDLKKLENLLAQGKITRRGFLARVSALGLTAAISPSLLITSAHASAPKRGGRLRIGCSGASTTDSFDPGISLDATPGNIFWQIRNCLTEVDYKGQLIPELAESWDSTPDAKKWFFKLRKGVEFHNGKSLNAEDVVFSINYHRGPDSKSAARAIVQSIKDINTDGKHTVVFTMEGGNADFPYILSDPHLLIVPNGTTNFNDGVGTGGYILADWEPGVRCLTKRNPNYWKEGRAHFDEVEMIGVNDDNARINAIKSKKVDVINRCDLKTVHLLGKDPIINVLNTASLKHYTFPMRTDMAPYDNNDVRMALKLAIDREHVVKMVLRGYGTVGNDHPIAPANQYYASELAQRRYDPDKAKFHLKKAGIDTYTFKLHTAQNTFPGSMDATMLYKEHAANAGINIEIVRVPQDGYWSNVWKKVEWCASYWSGRATEDWMFSMAYAAEAKNNDTYWKHERFNKLLKEARAELDGTKRREMYVEMQRICRDEGGTLIPMYANHVEAVSKKLNFTHIAGNWELDGQRCAERWWFA